MYVNILLVESKIFKSIEYIRPKFPVHKFYQPRSYKCHAQPSRLNCYTVHNHIWLCIKKVIIFLTLFDIFWMTLISIVCELCLQLDSFVCPAPSKVAIALTRRCHLKKSNILWKEHTNTTTNTQTPTVVLLTHSQGDVTSKNPPTFSGRNIKHTQIVCYE